MVNWRAIEAKVDRTVGSTFGESVRLSFLKKGVVDPDREALTVSALLHVEGDDPSTPGGRGSGKFAMQLSAGEAALFIDRSVYLGPAAAQGDRVQALDRAGKPWFEVAYVSDRHTNLIILTLTQA